MNLETFKEKFKVTPLIAIEVGGQIISEMPVAFKGAANKAFELLDKTFGKDLDELLKPLLDDTENEMDINTDSTITLRLKARVVK